MKDILGNELAVGDYVVTTVSKYEELKVGIIVKFTPKACRVRSIKNDQDQGNLKYSYQLMRVEEDIAVLYKLKKG
ncbi:hypothetical protein DRQ53_08635 [bacterium]|nr:MAG: hypothetical protein DRQ53_08635 [bacterium]